MSIRIASFNVENLFDRPKVMNETTLAQPNELLDAYATLNALIQEPEYTPAIKEAILDELGKLGLRKSDTAQFAILRQNHGRLLKRSGGNVEVVAAGRSSWIGWVELTRERTNGIAMDNTARVIRDVDADILGVIEAENRIALKHFTDAGLVKGSKPIYPQAVRARDRWRDLPDGSVGRQARDPLPALRHHDRTDPRRERPRCRVRGGSPRLRVISTSLDQLAAPPRDRDLDFARSPCTSRRVTEISTSLDQLAAPPVERSRDRASLN